MDNTLYSIGAQLYHIEFYCIELSDYSHIYVAQFITCANRYLGFGKQEKH